MAPRSRGHSEGHLTGRVGWLRAAVLGADDGIVSTSSLIIGVAASGATSHSVFIAGLAGLVAGAMSMAAGEYVSVHSQADTEKADLEREKQELKADKEGELMELAGIYAKRGLEPKLARQVAEQLMAHDALEAHARDELGITDMSVARPIQAAFSSAVSFSAGAALPLIVSVISPHNWVTPAVAASSLVFLAGLGAIAARAGGASMLTGALRVLFWGSMAMLATDFVGRVFGTSVS